MGKCRGAEATCMQSTKSKSDKNHVDLIKNVFQSSISFGLFGENIQQGGLCWVSQDKNMWKNKPPPQSSFAFLKSFVMGEGGYTNELIVGLETYMTGGQGAPGSQDALTSTQGGREGQSLIPRRE